jgi:hypothetical protein
MVGGTAAEGDQPDAEDDGIKPLPDRLVAELTAYRTLALREALANDPDMAFVAVLHALCLAAFYHYGTPTCSRRPWHHFSDQCACEEPTHKIDTKFPRSNTHCHPHRRGPR